LLLKQIIVYIKKEFRAIGRG